MEDKSVNQVPSPCINDCCLGDDDICLGCFRSLTEIMQWGQAGSSERRKILHKAQQRRAAKQ